MAAPEVSIQSITARKRHSPWRRRLFWAAVLLALGGGGWWWWQGREVEVAAVQYTTTPAAKGDITVTVSAVGTVEPIDQVDVGSLISGTISEVAVQINDQVRKGQVLARLDTSSLEAELARAEAGLSASRAAVEDALASKEAALVALERSRKMNERGLVTEEELTIATTAHRRAEAALASAEANVHVAEANVKLAQTALDKAVIVAPIDGIVLDMTASLGKTVSASGSTVVLFTLAHDLGEMELKVDVDEADIGKVQVGDAARFTVDAWQGEVFPGKVSAMHFAPLKVDGVVTYATILTIDNSDHRLRPGMTASAEIVVEDVKGALTVPNAAFRYAPPVQVASTQRSSGLLGMLFSGGGPGPQRASRTSVTNDVTDEGFRNLYVLRDGEAVKVAVKTGLSDGEVTEVLEGPLAEGDQVITAQK